MNLGQTLLTLLALVLFATITTTINRARVSATLQTVDHQVELEAINFAQSLVEVISNRANTQTGYDSMAAIFNGMEPERTFTAGSGRTLYSKIEVDDSGLQQLGAPYKKVTVSIFPDESRDEQYLKTRLVVTFSEWWWIDEE